MASVIRSVLRGEPARCSHGRQIRDYMHVQDVANGLVALLDSDVRGAVNVCSGQADDAARDRPRDRQAAGTTGAHPARRDSGAGERRAAGGRGQHAAAAGSRLEAAVRSGQSGFATPSTGGGRANRSGCYEQNLRAGNGHGRLRRRASAGRGGPPSSHVRQEKPLRRPHRLVPSSRASTHSTKGRTCRSPSTSDCRSLFADNIDGQYETLDTKVNNYWKGHWIKHPAQVNLHGLPPNSSST